MWRRPRKAGAAASARARSGLGRRRGGGKAHSGAGRGAHGHIHVGVHVHHQRALRLPRGPPALVECSAFSRKKKSPLSFERPLSSESTGIAAAAEQRVARACAQRRRAPMARVVCDGVVSEEDVRREAQRGGGKAEGACRASVALSLPAASTLQRDGRRAARGGLARMKGEHAHLRSCSGASAVVCSRSMSATAPSSNEKRRKNKWAAPFPASTVRANMWLDHRAYGGSTEGQLQPGRKSVEGMWA